MKKIFLYLLSLFLLLSFINAAGNEHYTIYDGDITLQGSNLTSGTTISATIGGANAGSTTTTTAGEYKLVVTLPSDYSNNDNVRGITFTLGTVSGYSSTNPLTGTNYSTSNDGKYVRLNLAFTGTAVTEAVAAAAAAAAAGAGGGAMAVAAAAPESLTRITEVTKVSDIIASLPEGWTNVEVYQVGTPTTETVKETLATVAENALKQATNTESISAIQNIQNKIKTGEVSQIGISKTLNVYKVTNKDSGESVYRSKITLTFTASKDAKEVKIIEVIPHSVVDSVEGIDFPGIKPEVLQNDPILQWIFENVKKDETKFIDYIIKKKLTKIESTTIGAATEKIEEKKIEIEKKPIITKAVIGIMIIVVIVLVGLIIYYQYIKKKKKKRG